MQLFIRGAMIAAVWAAGTSCFAQVDPWPMFRCNPARTGASQLHGCATVALSWSYATGHTIESSPVVGSDGTAYYGSYDNRIYAMSSSGTLAWSYDAGNFVSTSPAFDGDAGRVYVASYVGRLFACTLGGALEWSYETGGLIARSSPAVDSGGCIYLGSADNRLHVLSPAGVLAWSYETAGDVHSSPSMEGERVFVGSKDGRLYALGADGAFAWSYDTGKTIGESSPAVGTDGTVYVGEIDPGKTPVPCNLYAFNSSGGLAWSYATGDDVSSSPAIGAEGIVAASGDGTRWIIDYKTATPAGDLAAHAECYRAQLARYVDIFADEGLPVRAAIFVPLHRPRRNSPDRLVRQRVLLLRRGVRIDPDPDARAHTDAGTDRDAATARPEGEQHESLRGRRIHGGGVGTAPGRDVRRVRGGARCGRGVVVRPREPGGARFGRAAPCPVGPRPDRGLGGDAFPYGFDTGLSAGSRVYVHRRARPRGGAAGGGIRDPGLRGSGTGGDQVGKGAGDAQKKRLPFAGSLSLRMGNEIRPSSASRRASSTPRDPAP